MNNDDIYIKHKTNLKIQNSFLINSDSNYLNLNLIENPKIIIENLKSNDSKGLVCCTETFKYVTLVQGDIIFILIDLRKNSKSFLKSLKLDLRINQYLHIPINCGYGYISKQNSTLIFINQSSYTTDKDLILDPFDPKYNLEWPLIKSNKNILITGGAGFIGSHVSLLLANKYPQYNIYVYDLLDSCSNLNNLNDIKSKSNFKFIKGDVCDFNMVKYVLEEYKINWILHFAAQTHVDSSFVNSLEFSKTNFLGTHVLLECARLCNTERFIHVSTDEVYGSTDKIADINHPLEPTNPYACTKLAAECMVKSYLKCYNLPIIVTRGNNAYGPHQYVEKVIPKFINRLLKNKKCCIYENCADSERDFLYVTDVAEAFDLILHKGESGQFYNIGASKCITIIELAKKLVRIIKEVKNGEENEHIEFVNKRLLNDERYRIDCTRLKELGWSEKVDFDQGLIRTIEWYKSNQNYWKDIDQALEKYC